MIKELKMVRGAVAKKDIVPVLTHFHIYNKRIQGGNGKIAIDCPCDTLPDINITVPAERFLKAVDACSGEPNIKLKDDAKVIVSKRKFRATLPLLEQGVFPRNTPPEQFEVVEFTTVLDALRLLQPFIGDDATRLWTGGVWFHDGYAYATNNIVLVRTKVDLTVSFILPAYAIDEILRLNMHPTGFYLDETSLYLKYTNGMWLRSQLIEGQWPESVSEMIIKSKTIPIGKEFIEAVEKIVPFCPDVNYPRLCLDGGKVATDDGSMSAEVDGFKGMQGYYRAEPLLAVARVADHIDFSTYPKPCYFSGHNLEGILVGVKA